MFHLSSLETTNTALAAALSAVGIPLVTENPVKVLTGHGGNRHCFFFQPISKCGHFKTEEMIKAWNDARWHIDHPHHPFAYIKVAFENKERLTDYVRKQIPLYVEEKDGKLAFLSFAASPELEKKLFQRLNKKH